MDNKIIDKICSTAFNLSVIGVCIIGVCPAFAIMPVAIKIVLKKKNVELEGLNESKMKKAMFMCAVSMVMFAIDLVLAFKFLK